MNNVQSAKYWLGRAEASGSNESIQAMSLQAIGHALLAIQEELVKEDKVLPSLSSCSQGLVKDETVDNTPWVPPLSPVGTDKDPLWFGDAPVVDDEEPLPSLNDDTIVIDGKVWHKVPDDEEELDGFESP